jgi:anion-transporting  ArsA/GET3 family ATPase
MSEPLDVLPLRDLLAGRGVVACLGAGGVGKTTLAAALAVGLAAAGRRVLCLTIDPARRLADSLGIPRDVSDTVAIPAERLTEVGLAPHGTLHVAQLDATRTLAAVVRRRAPDHAAAERILENRLFRYLSGSLPGVQEMMALERLFAARADPRFDLVVLDTPPTTNALDFLDAPRRLITALDSPFAAWLTDDPQVGSGARAGGRGARLVLRLLARLTGPGLLEEMATLLQEARRLLPGFRARAEEIDAALRSSAVAFLLVTSSQPQAIDEAIFVNERLAALRPGGDAFVINRVRVRFARGAATDAPGEPRVPEDLAQRLRETLAEHERLAADDDAEIRRLMRRCGPSHRYYRVPAFATDVRDLRAVAEVARVLFAPSAAVPASFAASRPGREVLTGGGEGSRVLPDRSST